jgi:uncharacterized lipoprotein YmbA
MKISLAPIMVVVLLAIGPGCAKQPPPEIYLLDSAAPNHLPGFEKGIAIGVGPVELAPYLDRGQIISRKLDQALGLGRTPMGRTVESRVYPRVDGESRA